MPTPTQTKELVYPISLIWRPALSGAQPPREQCDALDDEHGCCQQHRYSERRCVLFPNLSQTERGHPRSGQEQDSSR